MTKREPVQGLWIGERLSKIEQLCVKSFLAHGHPFHLYAYNALEDAPSGVIFKDANEIIARERLFSYPARETPLRADWFRFALLAARGGWWVDMDVICLKPLDFAREIVSMRTMTHIFKYPADHPLPRAMAHYAAHPDSPAPWTPRKYRFAKFSRRWRVGLPFYRYRPPELAGSVAYEGALRHFGLQEGKGIVPDRYFSSATEGAGLLHLFEEDPSARAIPDDAYCVHLHNEALWRAKMDKNADFPATSPIERLKRRYGV